MIFIIKEYLKTPVSILKFLIIKNLHLKIIKKNIRQIILKINYHIINVKFIFLINTFTYITHTIEILWILKILKYLTALTKNILKK